MADLETAGLIDALLPAVLAAGRLQLDYRAAGITFETKGDSSPVTAADRESEALILRALAEAAPGVPVVAEESGASGHDLASAGGFFLVDPLDGTRAFVSGSDEFTINVGYIQGGRPTFGLIYAPARGALFATVRTGEAIEANIAACERVIRIGETKTSRLSARQRGPDAVGLMSHTSKPDATAAFLDQQNIRERRMIASSIKFCLIARGEADIYPRFGATSEWDTAAGEAILTAAGGSVLAAEGGSLLVYGKAAARFINPPFVARGRG